MASQGIAPNSRLAQMQMRFQQKQLQEREQKKLAMTTGDIANDRSSITAKNATGNGKVREMFERRRGVGIDRSHPLKPITTSSNTAITTKTSHQQPLSARRLTGGAHTTPRHPNNNTNKHSTMKPVGNLHSNTAKLPSNNKIFQSDLDEMDNLESETFPKEFSSLSLDNSRIMGAIVHDRDNNVLNRSINGKRDIMDSTITINKRPNTNGIKLNPVIMKKSPGPATGARTTPPMTGQSRTPSSAGRSSTTRISNGSTNMAPKSPVMKKPTTTMTTTKGTKGANSTLKGVNGKPATFDLAVKPPPRVITPPPGMANCQFCQRNFIEERLEKHQEVCRKMTAKKRKIFDASKHRVQGTEAEKYVKKTLSKTPSTTSRGTTVAHSNHSNAAADGKKNNWRKKHEEFINAIREAKKVQAHLAKGGKLSDLPPPPPSENPDYVQCPHCGRRFNESAAERHIPKCANMKHNKPKPVTQKKRY